MAALHVFYFVQLHRHQKFLLIPKSAKECQKTKVTFFNFINIENPSNDNIIRGGKKIKFTACPKPRRHFNKPQKLFDKQN